MHPSYSSNRNVKYRYAMLFSLLRNIADKKQTNTLSIKPVTEDIDDFYDKHES